MVPLPRYSTVAGVPLPELLSAETITRLSDRTANGGAEIVDLFKSGSAYYAPSACVLAMVDSIVLDQRRVFPCSVYLDGEYGYSDVFMGVPVKVGARGVEEIVQIDLTAEEKAALDKSAESVRELLAVMRERTGVRG
jgi:malate dehydrogenase